MLVFQVRKAARKECVQPLHVPTARSTRAGRCVSGSRAPRTSLPGGSQAPSLLASSLLKCSIYSLGLGSLALGLARGTWQSLVPTCLACVWASVPCLELALGSELSFQFSLCLTEMFYNLFRRTAVTGQYFCSDFCCSIRILITLIIGLIILLSPDPSVSSCFSCAKVRNSYIIPCAESLFPLPPVARLSPS